MQILSNSERKRLEKYAFVAKKKNRYRKTIKQQDRCIKRMKQEVRDAMGLTNKLLPDHTIWQGALRILKDERTPRT